MIPAKAVAQDRAEDDERREFQGRQVVFRGCAGSATADQPEGIELAELPLEKRRLAQAMASHDFLAPLQLSTRSAGEAMAVGAKESGTEMVIWTSSSAPWGESSVPAALDAATARKLISLF